MTLMVSKKKNALYLSVNVFSTKVPNGDINFTSPTGDYPRIPRGGQLSRKKGPWPIITWPIIDPILVTFGQM